MLHTHAIHPKYPNQLPPPPPMEHKPASNTMNLNLFHRAEREDFTMSTGNQDAGTASKELLLWSHRPGRCLRKDWAWHLMSGLHSHVRTKTGLDDLRDLFQPSWFCTILLSPAPQPSSPVQSRTPDLLHLFSHAPNQEGVLCLTAFSYLSTKISKQSPPKPILTTLLGDSSILGKVTRKARWARHEFDGVRPWAEPDPRISQPGTPPPSPSGTGGGAEPRIHRHGNAAAANRSRDTRRIPPAADGERRERAWPDGEVRPPPELRRSSMAQPGPTAPAPRGWPYHCGAGGIGVFFIGSALAQPAAFPSEMPGGQTEQRSIPAVARAANSAGRGCPSSSSACP